jgi:hypothetical protein
MWILPAGITVITIMWCIVTMWVILSDDEVEEYIKLVAAVIALATTAFWTGIPWLVWWML